MTNETRSPEQIERDIERDRQALSQNLDGIQQKFSFDTIAGQIGEQFREHGGDISRAMANSVKENPMAVALTGVGLAWMIFGSGRRGNGSHPYAHNSGRWNSEGRRDSAVRYGATTRVSAEPEWAHTDDDHAYGSDADRPPIDLTSKSASGNGEAADYAGASTSSSAQSASPSLAERAEQARERLAQGTENLSEAARERVVSAREKALEAKRKLVRSARHGADKVTDLFEEQPLVSGALSFAVGAAIGSALPRTQTEDAAMGEYSDTLIAEAERLFKEEQANAARVLGAATEEAKSIVHERSTNRDGAAPGV